jgi:hypothetical protein
VKFFQNSFQNRFWKKSLEKCQKKIENFRVLFFAKLLSFEFSQKKFTSDVEKFLKIRSKTVLKSFLKILQKWAGCSVVESAFSYKTPKKSLGFFSKTRRKFCLKKIRK